MTARHEQSPDVGERHDPSRGGDQRALDALQPGQLRSLQIKAMTDDLGIKVKDLRTIGSVSEQTIRNWKNDATGTGLPRGLDDLRAVAEHMLDSGDWSPAQVGIWFFQRNRHLDQELPFDLLVEGRFDEVYAATDRHLVLAV